MIVFCDRFRYLSLSCVQAAICAMRLRKEAKKPRGSPENPRDAVLLQKQQRKSASCALTSLPAIKLFMLCTAYYHHQDETRVNEADPAPKECGRFLKAIPKARKGRPSAEPVAKTTVNRMGRSGRPDQALPLLSSPTHGVA